MTAEWNEISGPKEATASLKADVSLEVLGQAIQAWARDSGWVLARAGSESLIFSADLGGIWGRLNSRFPLGMEMLASISRRDRRTCGEFTITVPSILHALYPGDLQRAAKTFSKGVARYLEHSAAKGTPSKSDPVLFSITRRGRAVKWLKWVQRLSTLAFVPLLVSSLVLYQRSPFLLLIMAWDLTIMLTAGLTRYRVFGMRARYFAFTTYMICALALVFTVVEASN